MENNASANLYTIIQFIIICILIQIKIQHVFLTSCISLWRNTIFFGILQPQHNKMSTKLRCNQIHVILYVLHKSMENNVSILIKLIIQFLTLPSYFCL